MRRYLLMFISLAGLGVAAECPAADDGAADGQPKLRTLPIVIAANVCPPYILPFALPEHLIPDASTEDAATAESEVSPSPIIQISVVATETAEQLRRTNDDGQTLVAPVVTTTPTETAEAAKTETVAVEKLRRTNDEGQTPSAPVVTTAVAETAEQLRITNYELQTPVAPVVTTPPAENMEAARNFLLAVKQRWRDFAAATSNRDASASAHQIAGTPNDNTAVELEIGTTAKVESENGATVGANVESQVDATTKINVGAEIIDATAGAKVESEISGANVAATANRPADAPLMHEAVTIAMPDVAEESGENAAAAPPPHKDNVAEVADEINKLAATAEIATAEETAKITAPIHSPNAPSEKFSATELAANVPATNESSANERDLAAIQRRGVLVVGMLRGNPPPFADGDEHGCDADWAAALARVLQVKLQINRDFDSTANLLTAVADGGVDAAISGLKIGSPTVAGVEIASPYLGKWTVLLLNFAALKEIPDGEFLTPEALNRPEVVVAVEAGSSYEKIARELFPRATLRREVYADGASPFWSVFGKDAHVALRDSFSLLRDRREHPQRWEQRGAEVAAVKLRRHRELYGVALAKTAPRLRALLDRLDAEINDMPLPFEQLRKTN